MPKRLSTPETPPPGEGHEILPGVPQVGDRVAYRDQTMMVDGFYLAAAGPVAMVVALGVPQIIPLPLDKLVVLERGVLKRKIALM